MPLVPNLQRLPPDWRGDTPNYQVTYLRRLLVLLAVHSPSILCHSTPYYLFLSLSIPFYLPFYLSLFLSLPLSHTLSLSLTLHLSHLLSPILFLSSPLSLSLLPLLSLFLLCLSLSLSLSLPLSPCLDLQENRTFFARNDYEVCSADGDVCDTYYYKPDGDKRKSDLLTVSTVFFYFSPLMKFRFC